MNCPSCGAPPAEHCAIHLVPCCPGKCAGEAGLAVSLNSGGPAEEGHVVGLCHCGFFHPYRAAGSQPTPRGVLLSIDLEELARLANQVELARRQDELEGNRVLTEGVEYHPWRGGHVLVTAPAAWQLIIDAGNDLRPEVTGIVGGMTGIPIYRGTCPCEQGESP